ncbi:MAG TPA: hypothetical protein VMH78_00670, partial [Thermoplasmata archaeon]|nr:hypothetical protein [Thermoplasmata archaeon]
MAATEDSLEVLKRQEQRLEKAISALRRAHHDEQEYANELIAPYASLLISVRADIDHLLGVGPIAGADIEIRVESPEIGREGAPSGILTETLDRLRKALAGTYAAVGKFRWSGRGRYTEEIRRAADIRVLALVPGSLRLGIDLPEPFHRRTMDNFGPRPSPTPGRAALAALLAASKWAASDSPPEALSDAIPDPTTRKSVLEQVRRLSPSPKGKITTLEISGVSMQIGDSAKLTHAARSRARVAAYPGGGTQEFDDVGQLRALNVDLDEGRRVFVLRKRSGDRPSIRGDFPPELAHEVLDAIKHGYRVRVGGILETKGNGRGVLHLGEIERQPEE